MSVLERARDLRAPLLRWYRRHRRDLPWRRTRDPYAIWVSEIMLQQTQVSTVVPYYRRFLQRFPDPASLAAAEEEEVLGLWSGLGYYRRARALRAGARAIVERHGGELPSDVESLRALPGVGRYTSGAIASIAFDCPVPVLDGNVRRVLSRLFARKRDPASGDGGDEALWNIAGILVEGAHPGDLNQALMELGALVCLPRKPDCPRCPVRRSCRARARGNPEAYPARQPGRSVERVGVAVAWIVRAGRLLLERPGDGNPLRGAWDLPSVELQSRQPAEAVLNRRLAKRHGIDVRVGRRAAGLSHGIMHRRLRLEVFHCRLRRGRVASRDDLCWLGIDRLDVAAVSGATLKVARTLAAESGVCR